MHNKELERDMRFRLVLQLPNKIMLEARNNLNVPSLHSILGLSKFQMSPMPGLHPIVQLENAPMLGMPSEHPVVEHLPAMHQSMSS